MKLVSHLVSGQPPPWGTGRSPATSSSQAGCSSLLFIWPKMLFLIQLLCGTGIGKSSASIFIHQPRGEVNFLIHSFCLFLRSQEPGDLSLSSYLYYKGSCWFSLDTFLWIPSSDNRYTCEALFPRSIRFCKEWVPLAHGAS